MKNLRKFLLMIVITTVFTAKVDGQSCNYLCPLLNDVTVLEAQGCPEVAMYQFSLQTNHNRLCAGETFTFRLKNANGTVIASQTSTSDSFFYNLTYLCEGTYTICVSLNSSIRDCPEETCDTFYLYNNTGCCADS